MSGGFAKGTRFLMANGRMKAVEEMEVGDQINGGSVTEVRCGVSDNQWCVFHGVHLTDDQFVFENGEWKRAKDAARVKQILPYDRFYTLSTTNHRLFGINDTTLADDQVFSRDHAVWAVEQQQRDEMLAILNANT